MRKTWDPWLFFTVAALATVGILIVGSASSYVAMRYWGSTSYLFWKQMAHLAVGLGALFVAMKLPYRWLSSARLIWSAFAVCALLLVLVFFMPGAGGAHRWIVIGPVRFQPSEFAKLFAVVYLANLIGNNTLDINDLRRMLVPAFAVLVPICVLIAAEPDMSTAVVIAAVAMVMTVVAGLRRKYVGVISSVGLIGAVAAVLVEPYRLRRILDFMLYLCGIRPADYQVSQSWVALGSGGIFGVGLGHSQQKAFFVPAAHTDFIFSIIGEEFGFVGTMALLTGFLLIVWRGMRTACMTRDSFGAYLALGLTGLLGLQALVHMGVCVGFLPPTGLPLPFISYGGSSLVASLIAVGLLLNVSRECNLRTAMARRRVAAPPVPRMANVPLRELNVS